MPASLRPVIAAGQQSRLTNATPPICHGKRATPRRFDLHQLLDESTAGGDRFNNGWQATLDSYRKGYPDAAAMGKLDFDLVEVRELAPDVVYVFGKWHLSRAGEAADKAPHGLFTLILERINGIWAVTRDHTSAAGG